MFFDKVASLSTSGYCSLFTSIRGGSRAAATSKMERFMIIVNGWKQSTIIRKSSLLDVAAVLDPPLSISYCSVADMKNKSISRANYRLLSKKADISEHF